MENIFEENDGNLYDTNDYHIRSKIFTFKPCLIDRNIEKMEEDIIKEKEQSRLINNKLGNEM